MLYLLVVNDAHLSSPHGDIKYSTKLDEALAFAALKHVHQVRKGSPTPYIVHPVQVAWLLRSYGFDETTVMAGLLHDVLEDTDCTRVELESRFGHEISEIVWWCTEPDKSLSWEQRKADAVARMQVMPDPARAVCAADKAHNLHVTADALLRGQKDVWQRFKRGASAQMDYHKRALMALKVGFEHPILDELRLALERVETLLGNLNPS